MSDGTTLMTRLVRIVLLLGGAAGLFSAGLVGTLGVRGKLNAEYLGPLLGGPEQEAETEGPPAAPHAGPAARPHQEAERRTGSAAGDGLLPPITLPSPFSSEETTALFEELEATRVDLRERSAQLQREQKDFELVRVDLNRRWDELNRREEELEETIKSLAAERQELDGRSVLLEEAELANIQQLAEDVEKMPSEAAAALLTEKTAEEAAKILKFVKPREAGKILAALPPKLASSVSQRMLGVLQADGSGKSGGK
ncbi:MAG: hypothetical protein HY812_12615 [Planctomycetes bacterium]|nr:hypothetical protein [Planctomycetota bacterium]